MLTSTGRAPGSREQPVHRLESWRGLGTEGDRDEWEGCVKGKGAPVPADSLGLDAGFICS